MDDARGREKEKEHLGQYVEQLRRISEELQTQRVELVGRLKDNSEELSRAREQLQEEALDRKRADEENEKLRQDLADALRATQGGEEGAESLKRACMRTPRNWGRPTKRFRQETAESRRAGGKRPTPKSDGRVQSGAGGMGGAVRPV